MKPRLVAYSGNEPAQSVRDFAEMLTGAPEDQFAAVMDRFRAAPGVGLSLKTFSASLLESSLGSLQSFPVEYQRRIHEFRNHLSITNQEIERALEAMRLTYDSSMSDENHQRLADDLGRKYGFIEGMCRRVCERLDKIIEYDIRKI